MVKTMKRLKDHKFCTRSVTTTKPATTTKTPMIFNEPDFVAPEPPQIITRTQNRIPTPVVKVG